MYNRPRYYRRRQSHFADYLMPFLIIISVGVILILFISLLKSFFGDKDVNAAYLHIIEGSVDMRTWGSDDYINLTSDALVLQGDEVTTLAGSKVIVEFFDGSIMRLDGGTDVVFEEFDQSDSDAAITLMLVDGSMWFNKLASVAGATEVSVKMPNVVVNSDSASVFEVESGIDDVVRGIRGKDFNVEVMDSEGRKVLMEEELGVGQQIVFSSAVMDRYWQYQAPEVITSLSDDFELSDWYAWNIAEDEEPTQFEKSIGDNQFIKVEPEVLDEMNVEDASEEEVVDQEEVVEEEATDDGAEVVESVEPEVSAELAVPTVVSVGGVTEPNADGFYVVTSSPATITGGAVGAYDIVVNTYELQQYSAYAETWNYYANADYGYMKEGENTYEIYAKDEDGKKSDSLFIKVLYEPAAEPVVEAEPEEPEVEPLFGP